MKHDIRRLLLSTSMVMALVHLGCDDSPLTPDELMMPPASNGPLACFTMDPGVSEIEEGESIALDAGCSEQVTAQASYRWDLGDGRTRTGARIEVQYPEPGRYTIRLVVEDGGAESTAAKELTVTDGATAALDACFTWQQVRFAPNTAPCSVTFDASCSEGNIVEYRWFFAGGPPVAGRFPDANRTTTTPQIEYSWGLDVECLYFRPFERLVRLTIVDAEGNTDEVEDLVEFVSEF